MCLLRFAEGAPKASNPLDPSQVIGGHVAPALTGWPLRGCRGMVAVLSCGRDPVLRESSNRGYLQRASYEGCPAVLPNRDLADGSAQA